ncbi:MAG: bifunctional molybdenum cofactor biosynthesis protein MoaC/MoaB [Chlorobi bacterium]|nr:bifunctional molybdenum cofactor biosynthesis protein MoaC/MoaB [Chlorobiota bacterium]
MRDVSEKPVTLRRAIAEGFVVVDPTLLDQTPKKDVLATARAGALLAIKKTWETIPDCHPIPVDYAEVSFEILKDRIRIVAEVKSIARTGCEMEALNGVATAALIIYDMLKPVVSDISIESIRLLLKEGGKSSLRKGLPDEAVSTAIIVISDSVHAGKKEDKAGKAIQKELSQYENIQIVDYDIVPDEPEQILRKVKEHVDKGTDIIITTGGTGIGPRDQTPETIRQLFDKELEGVGELVRSYGQQYSPYAYLSRATGGLSGRSLILVLPGSTKGAKESIKALMPHILHVIKVRDKFYKH